MATEGSDVVITLELPGVDVSDIDIEVADGRLTISGERKDHWEDSRGKVLVREMRYGAFRRTMSTLESIEFRRTATVSQAGDTAQVAVDTVARHTDRVDRCRGTLDLARGGAGGWLIDRARIACTAGGGGARAATASHAGAAATSSEDATGSRSGSTASAAGGSATAAREGGRKAGKAKAETKGGSASTSAEPNE